MATLFYNSKVYHISLEVDCHQYSLQRVYRGTDFEKSFEKSASEVFLYSFQEGSCLQELFF